jgi:phenylpropionate dioxygenase-like ring-hydroxylating dioxygenase large terminal subunit
MSEPMRPDPGTWHTDVAEVLAGLGPDAAERVLPPKAYHSAAFHAFEHEAVFMHAWLCAGRVEQLPQPGDYLALNLAGESVVIARGRQGEVHAMSALCRHRGHPVVPMGAGHADRLVCAYHRWTYDIEGRLVGAPHMAEALPLAQLRAESSLPRIRCEVWRGFVFVNFDDHAEPLAPSLTKLEPYFEGYPMDDLAFVPAPSPGTAMPWNWKILLENYIEPYHTEFVHPVIHDFAPSTGVAFDPWQDGDNAISRGVPFLAPGGGLTDKGWAAPASFPVIDSLSAQQKSQVAFCLLPPTMNLIFTPDMICFGIVYPSSPTSLSVSGGLFTAGGWLMPKSSVALPDFDARAARLMEGSRQLGEQDTGINVAMQAAKASRHAPRGRLAPLEATLSQFNQWLIAKYRAQAARSLFPFAE